MAYRYALATTPEVDRRLLQALADVLAEDRRASDGGDFGQVIAGRSEQTLPTPASLVAALRQTLEGRIMGGERGNPIQIQTVERLPLDVLQRLEGAGARLVPPDAEDEDAAIQILHLQHLLRLAHAAAARIPPPPADDGTVQARVATPEESSRRETLARLRHDLVETARGQILRGVPDEELITILARCPRGEFIWDLPINALIASAHRDIATEEERSLVKHNADAWRYRLTPAAVAERFADSYHDELRYVSEIGAWRYWDRVVWALDEGEVRTTSLVKGIVLQIAQEIAATVEPDVMTKIADKKVSPLLTPSGIRNVLSFAAKDRRIRVSAEVFDGDPYLLNLVDGTVDLRTGIRRLHRREDFLTRLAGVVDGNDMGLRYDPNATCPTWETCVKEWFVHDAQSRATDHETIRAVQQRAGYWLSGLTCEHEFMTWYAPKGRNGKGVFKNILLAISGQYGVTGETSTFVKRGAGSKGSARGDLAALYGKRVVFISEPDEGDVLDEAFVKQLTGDDRISFRPPYGRSNIDFRPTFKLTILANHPPAINGNDSIWDRQRILVWKRRFEPEEQNRDLEALLMGELPGILNWMIAGFRDYCAAGRLYESPEMVDAKKRYEVSQRPHWVEFIEDRCVLRSQVPERYRDAVKCHRSTLHNSYLQWCMENGLTTREQLGRNKFYSVLINQYGLREQNVRGVGRAMDGVTTKEHFEGLLNPEDRRLIIGGHMDLSVLV